MPMDNLDYTIRHVDPVRGVLHLATFHAYVRAVQQIPCYNTPVASLLHCIVEFVLLCIKMNGYCLFVE
jgi:hypothetical protein